MAKQIYYKKYNRGTRLQTVDTIYSGGMSYTNTPLAEQYSKALVNYDITKDNTLRSRPGLVRIKQYNHDKLSSAMQLLDAQSITTFDTKHTYQHLVLGAASGVNIDSELTTLKSGALTFCKCDDDALVIDENNNAVDALACSYTASEIHGLHMTEPMLRYVGTRAYNNDYYWFAPDGALNHAGYLLTAYDQDTNKATYDFTAEAVTPKVCKMSEVNARGYNMLSKTPYAAQSAYESTLEVDATLTGIVPYSDPDCTQIELTPKLGQTVYLKIVGEFKIDTIGGSARLPIGAQHNGLHGVLEVSINNGVSFYEVNTFDLGPDECSVAAFKQRCVVPYVVSSLSNVLVRATLSYKRIEELIPLSVYVTVFNFEQKKDTEAINYDLQTYTLKYAEGMTYWKERLILWGVPEDKTMLFVSEVRDPSYFPYPNNVSLFDEPIVNVVPLLDNLVVFTTSKIYIMGVDTDYVHLTQTCIQNNLRINPYDVHLMQVVKNMIFFKSGNYYYMIVPKAQSLTGELTIAPVSKSIEYFLDNFKEELYTTLEIVYNYSRADCDALDFVHYYNYLDYEDVTNVYVFKTPEGRYLNFCLLYNTIQRHWRMYTYETSSIMQPVTHDATDKSIYGVLTNNAYETYRFDHDTAVDTMGTIFKNYQLYDSGYRDQEYNLKKRYRELQFIVYNRSLKNLKFGTGFFIDGGTHRALYKMELMIKPLSDVAYNTTYTGTEQHVELVINHTFDNVAEVPGATVLGSWIIDQSVFPEQTIYKVRFPVAGKGYAPRVLLVNKDELQHDILNTSYVYRSLYTR